jgi:hypothetical protein
VFHALLRIAGTAPEIDLRVQHATPSPRAACRRRVAASEVNDAGMLAPVRVDARAAYARRKHHVRGMT